MVLVAGNENSTRSSKITIRGDLCKKILSHYGCEKRVPNETADAMAEVLRMFIVEVRARASIEVSFNVMP
jgi:hypothetical protein